MKKLLFAVCLATATIFSTSLCIFGGTIPKVNLNNNKLLLLNSPFVENGVTYVPLQSIQDNTGKTLDKSKLGDVKEKDNIVYAPVRNVVEALGAELEYDQKTNTVNIKYTMPTDAGQKYDDFGRLIRTTNLPTNADLFPYISSGVPNEMYEMQTAYEKTTWKIVPVEGDDFIKPINLKNDEWYSIENLKLWQNNLEKNLDLRFNVDYRTVDSNWVNELLTTYPSRYGQPYFLEGYTDMLNKYVQYIKDNHIIFEGDYYVEPSATYLKTGAYYLRTWVKFRITSDNVNTAHIFDNTDYPVELKTNKWYIGYTDMSQGTNNVDSTGSDLTIDYGGLGIGNVK